MPLVGSLKGEANPSGHNTFTFAANSLGAPGTVNFGDYNMTGNLGGHDKAGKFVVYITLAVKLSVFAS